MTLVLEETELPQAYKTTEVCWLGFKEQVRDWGNQKTQVVLVLVFVSLTMMA